LDQLHFHYKVDKTITKKKTQTLNNDDKKIFTEVTEDGYLFQIDFVGGY